MGKHRHDKSHSFVVPAAPSEPTRGRELTREERYAFELTKARELLAARGRIISAQQVEIANLRGEVMMLSAQIEAQASATVRQNLGWGERVEVTEADGKLYYVQQSAAPPAPAQAPAEELQERTRLRRMNGHPAAPVDIMSSQALLAT